MALFLNQFSISNTPTLDTLVQDQLFSKEASNQSPDQVNDIEPSTTSTPFKRKLFQISVLTSVKQVFVQDEEPKVISRSPSG